MYGVSSRLGAGPSFFHVISSLRVTSMSSKHSYVTMLPQNQRMTSFNIQQHLKGPWSPWVHGFAATLGFAVSTPQDFRCRTCFFSCTPKGKNINATGISFCPDMQLLKRIDQGCIKMAVQASDSTIESNRD